MLPVSYEPDNPTDEDPVSYDGDNSYSSLSLPDSSPPEPSSSDASLTMSCDPDDDHASLGGHT